MSTPGAIIVGYDGSDRGVDALSLGRRLARTSGDRLVVTTIHPQEAAHSLGALDTEWVACLREQAMETIEGAKGLPGALRTLTPSTRCAAPRQPAGVWTVLPRNMTLTPS